MLCVIPFFSGDALLAHNLLRWIGQLGGCKNHDCLLVSDAGTPWPMGKTAYDLAKESFRSVTCISNPRSVSGWIPGSVSLFGAAMTWARGQKFFWLEPDAVPLKANWLDQLESAYAACGKKFMGAMVTHDNPNFPNPYLEGCAVYPPDCHDILIGYWRMDLSWVRACAPVVVPQAVNSTLIHHLWGEKDRGPVFAEKNVPGTNVFCLDQINPEAMVFHRCKDGSLIHLLRKSIGIDDEPKPPKCFVQLGRHGDIILLLPAFKEWADRTKQKTIVVTSEEFGNVFDGVSYVTPVKLKVKWMQDLPQALSYAKNNWPDAILTQLNGGGIHDKPDGLSSYSLSMWSRTGLLDLYATLPLVFDQRNRTREDALFSKVAREKKPILLTSSKGQTSPLKDQRVFQRIAAEFWTDFQIVDLNTIRLPYVYDLLGLMDRAVGLITIDTMHLHLAAGSPTPYIALTRSDGRPASVPKGNCVLNVGYADAMQKLDAILEVINGWRKSQVKA